MKRKHDINDVIIPLLLVVVVLEFFPNVLDDSLKKYRTVRADYSRCAFDVFLERHRATDPNISNILRMSKESFDNL